MKQLLKILKKKNNSKHKWKNYYEYENQNFTIKKY